MNKTLRANFGYSAERMIAQDPTEIEYAILARLTHSLRETFQNKNDNFAMYVEALSKNLKFWNLLAVDVLEPTNGLSTELRGQIFWLSQYVSQETRNLIRNNENLSPDNLLEINTNLMQGLRMQKA